MKIGLVDEPAEALDLVRIIDVDLDGSDVAGAVEVGLRLRQRHEHEGGVVLRHAHLENRRDLVRLDAWHRAQRGHGPARRNERHAVAHPQRELVGEPLSDRHPLAGVEAFERALPNVVGDRGQLGQIGGAHAAHEHSGGAEG
jgi:hypothetical protein